MACKSLQTLFLGWYIPGITQGRDVQDSLGSEPPRCHSVLSPLVKASLMAELTVHGWGAHCLRWEDLQSHGKVCG